MLSRWRLSFNNVQRGSSLFPHRQQDDNMPTCRHCGRKRWRLIQVCTPPSAHTHTHMLNSHGCHQGLFYLYYYLACYLATTRTALQNITEALRRTWLQSSQMSSLWSALWSVLFFISCLSGLIELSILMWDWYVVLLPVCQDNILGQLKVLWTDADYCTSLEFLFTNPVLPPCLDDSCWYHIWLFPQKEAGIEPNSFSAPSNTHRKPKIHLL